MESVKDVAVKSIAMIDAEIEWLGGVIAEAKRANDRFVEGQKSVYEQLIRRALCVLVMVVGLSWTAHAETWVATAYCPCVECCNKSDGITASGTKAKAGQTVAINWIPFNTRVWIDGKVYYVEDRGARSIFGSKDFKFKRVDIYFDTHAQAVEFGRRTVDVVVDKEV